MAIYEHTAGDRTPFTYVIHCSVTNQSYYGVRYGKGCHPNQLWRTYFTSSKNVSRLIEQHGRDCFSIEIRRIFNCPKEALRWENRVLKRIRAVDDFRWINKSDGDKFRHNATLSDEVRKKMSNMRKGVPKPRTPEHQANLTKALKGRASPQKGKPLSEETKQKLSKQAKGRPSARKGRSNSIEHCKKISDSLKGRVRSQSIEERNSRSIMATKNGFGETCKGLIWVNDGMTSKRIKPEDLESSGFIRGRLVKRADIAEPSPRPA